jgi:hypothetical protein
MVITRSQSKKSEIDFDEASAAWRKNKKHIGNGQFVYLCAECNRECKIGILCKKHQTKTKK